MLSTGPGSFDRSARISWQNLGKYLVSILTYALGNLKCLEPKPNKSNLLPKIKYLERITNQRKLKKKRKRPLPLCSKPPSLVVTPLDAPSPCLSDIFPTWPAVQTQLRCWGGNVCKHQKWNLQSEERIRGDKGSPPNWRAGDVSRGLQGTIYIASRSDYWLNGVFKSGFIKVWYLPECLLKLQIPRPHSTSVRAECQGVGPRELHFNSFTES